METIYYTAFTSNWSLMAGDLRFVCLEWLHLPQSFVIWCALPPPSSNHHSVRKPSMCPHEFHASTKDS